jgi:hypothetical protein
VCDPGQQRTRCIGTRCLTSRDQTLDERSGVSVRGNDVLRRRFITASTGCWVAHLTKVAPRPGSIATQPTVKAATLKDHRAAVGNQPVRREASANVEQRLLARELGIIDPAPSANDFAAVTALDGSIGLASGAAAVAAKVRWGAWDCCRRCACVWDSLAPAAAARLPLPTRPAHQWRELGRAAHRYQPRPASGRPRPMLASHLSSSAGYRMVRRRIIPRRADRVSGRFAG